MWENMTPSTELPRDFCAGIGPLQLGVVLVLLLLYQTALIAVLYIERDCVIDESKKAFCYYFNDLDIKRIEADHSLLCPNTKESTEYDL